MAKSNLLLTAVLLVLCSSGLTYVVMNHRQERRQAVKPSEESYFTNDVYSDEEQKGRTVEEMVKRCESAEVLLKVAGGQVMPAIQPMSNEEAAKRLVEIGVCVGSLGTFTKVNFPGRVCLPSHKLTPIQAIRIFLNWAQKNPGKLEENFTVGYLESFEDAFPCKHTENR